MIETNTLNKIARYNDERDISDTLSFTDRDSYVRWDKDWKFQYGLMVADIRGFRSARKQDADPYKNKRGHSAQAMRQRLREQSRAMQMIRKVAKREADRQYKETMIVQQAN